MLFVCENNQYATEIAFAYAAGNPNVGERGAAYGLPGLTVDGNDVLEVYRAAGEAIARARAGAGPTLLECRTYRTRAHAEGMRDVGYRTQEEVERWKARDPIIRQRTYLTDSGTASAEELDEIEAEVQVLVVEAEEFARNSPWPEGATRVTMFIMKRPCHKRHHRRPSARSYHARDYLYRSHARGLGSSHGPGRHHLCGRRRDRSTRRQLQHDNRSL